MNPIRAARKASGLSRRRLSELTGIHDRQLSDYERGRYRPTGERLEKLAQVLNVEPVPLVVCSGAAPRGPTGHIGKSPLKSGRRRFYNWRAWPATLSAGILRPSEHPALTGKTCSRI